MFCFVLVALRTAVCLCLAAALFWRSNVFASTWCFSNYLLRLIYNVAAVAVVVVVVAAVAAVAVATASVSCFSCWCCL